ncbi:dTDP-4-dehydrorhamnose 3,5-epimerase, partial [Leptospira kmetyi]
MDSFLEGVIATPLKEIFDPKGSVLHMIRADDPEYKGFGECYFSEVNPGAIKAWKLHTKQTQNFTVP